MESGTQAAATPGPWPLRSLKRQVPFPPQQHLSPKCMAKPSVPIPAPHVAIRTLIQRLPDSQE